jgi:hypothetical protein
MKLEIEVNCDVVAVVAGCEWVIQVQKVVTVDMVFADPWTFGITPQYNRDAHIIHSSTQEMTENVTFHKPKSGMSSLAKALSGKEAAERREVQGAAAEWAAHCADQREQDEDTALVTMVDQEAKVEQKPQRKPRPKRVYLSAETLREKADAMNGELQALSDAYYKKFDEWQATIQLSRKQKKFEKRQEYQKRNLQERLRQAGHKVPQLDPAQLRDPDTMREHSVLRLENSDADTPEPAPVPAAAPPADSGNKKLPPGGKAVSKDKRVKR